MLKEKIEEIIKDSLSKGIESGALGELSAAPDTVAVELPKNPEHGDRAISIAMKLSREAKLAPRTIAEAIKENIDDEVFESLEIAGPGFINLKLNWDFLEDLVREIISQDTNYGRLPFEQRPDKSFNKILIEYVSANPTGDLHLGHGRQAVLGSAMAKLMESAGYDVTTEFYINDAGAQIEKLGKSCKQAVMIQENLLEKEAYDSENNYPLDSMLEFITPEQYNSEKASLRVSGRNLIEIPQREYAHFARGVFLEAQREILKEARTTFHQWYSEKENLHQEDDLGRTLVDKVCAAFALNGHSYEEEGALWFRAEDFGDERNRVLKKADGKYTYLAADLAYHKEKLERGFDKLINLWGADHHGQIPGIKGALEAMGEAADKLEIVLIQMVSLTRNGEEVKMSKRSGNFVTVRELVEEVGVDAFRYFLVESQANNRMVFDLELAKKQDKDNPVYYVQYAHARSSSILRNLTQVQLDQELLGGDSKEEALMKPAELDALFNDFKTGRKVFADKFSSLEGDSLKSTKALILGLANFSEEIKEAALIRAPYKIANYVKELAGLFHQFYTHNRVIVEDEELMQARILLVKATQVTIRNALYMLGISAPERM